VLLLASSCCRCAADVADVRSLNSFAAAATPCCSNSFQRVFRILTAAILLAFVFFAAFAGFTLSLSWFLLLLLFSR